MGKIKIIFSALTLIISVFFVASSLKFEQKLNPKKYTEPVFQVIAISENSKLFQDLNLQTPLTVKDKSFENDLRIKTDSQTSFELLFKGALLYILPNSYIHYNTGRQKLSFISGEIYWKRVKKSPVSLYTEEDQNPITIAESGRIARNSENELKIWSYKGTSILKKGQDFIEILPEKYLYIDADNKHEIYRIPKATNFISPEKKDIHIRKITDFLIKIDWKKVPGVTEYIVKIYPSMLRETLLLEKTVSSNRIGIDLLEFEQNREFFWEVLPLNNNKTEGIPSKMGNIRLFGVLVSEERDNRPPELAITSLTVNGNMVLARGSADTNSELFVDEVLVKIDNNGIFIYTKKFKTLGLKKIIFRLVSPSGVETIQTKQVTIYEE